MPWESQKRRSARWEEPCNPTQKDSEINSTHSMLQLKGYTSVPIPFCKRFQPLWPRQRKWRLYSLSRSLFAKPRASEIQASATATAAKTTSATTATAIPTAAAALPVQPVAATMPAMNSSDGSDNVDNKDSEKRTFTTITARGRCVFDVFVNIFPVGSPKCQKTLIL